MGQSTNTPETALDTVSKYEELLKEKVEEIRKICVREQIPCFLAFGLRDANQTEGPYQIKEEGNLEELQIKATTIIPEVLPVALQDRRFSDFINILNHFHAVPPSEYAPTTAEDFMVDLPPEDSREHMAALANMEL